MSERPDFESALRREVARVLADPAFTRSPVQSRLLTYLCDQTVARSSVSQLAVAVDGLGRPETADQLTESYPRVQISRLRRNLSLYYARCAPGEGLAVYIPHGDYRLRLAAPDSAYAAQRQNAPAPAAANDMAAAAAPAAPVAAGRHAAGGSLRGWLPLGAAAVTGVLLALAASWLFGRGPGADGTVAPALEIWIDGQDAGAPPDPLLVLASQHADVIAGNSYVVRNPGPQDTAGDAPYVVRLRRSQSVAARPVLDVSLFDASNQHLFHDSIPLGDDDSIVLSRLNGVLIQMVSPLGLIAARQLAHVGEEPRSDYECVLRTESDRLQGSGLSTALAEACLRRFPVSDYRAYWLSRMAFVGYRNQVLSGGLVEQTGQPWQYLQQALAADSTNPFANYVAAKVNFARGDCEAARPFAARALNNGNFYGSLTATTIAESVLCSSGAVQDQDDVQRVVSLVEAIPEPNPLMHIYLIFAAAAVDRPDLARRLLSSPTLEDPEGSMVDAYAALQAGLAGPEAFASNRTRLQRVVDGFYWGTNARQGLMDKLEAVAAHRA